MVVWTGVSLALAGGPAACWSGLLASVGLPRLPWWLALWFGVWFGLVLVLAQRSARAALKPSNWLLHVHSQGILLNCRAYQNTHHPPEALSQIFFQYRELAWVRQRRIWRATGLGSGRRRVRVLELALRAPHRLDMLRIREMVAGASGKGARSSYGVAPVHALGDDRLLVTWDALPTLSTVTKALAGRLAVLEPEDDTRGPAHAHGLQQDLSWLEAELLDAGQRGDTMTAVKLARRRYGMGLTEVKKFVEGLRSPPQSPDAQDGS